MLQWIMFFLFVIKHGLIANLWDAGYSESRRCHSTAEAWVYLCYQLLLEALWSLFLLGLPLFVEGPHYVWRWETFLMIEAVGQVVTWMLERRAPVTQMLSVHVVAEIAYLLLYILLLVALYPF